MMHGHATYKSCPRTRHATWSGTFRYDADTRIGAVPVIMNKLGAGLGYFVIFKSWKP